MLKKHPLKWLACLSILAIGCENAAPIPVSQHNEATSTSNTGTSNSTTPPVNTGNSGTLTPPENNVPAPMPIPVPAPPVVSVPVVTPIPFVQQTEGQTAHNLDKSLNSIRQYLAYVPAGYNAKPDAKWPVIIFLHGNSELGNDVNKIFWTYFAWKTQDKRYPYLLITPQLLPGNNEWSATDLNKLLDEVLPKYAVDPSRIILTGYSLGAHGVWDLAELTPERFAGIVPVSGWGDKNKAYTLKNTPTWAFHGDADNVVNASGSIDMINAIKNSGGTRASLTLYPGRGHDVQSNTYDNPEVINWMLTQKK